MSQDRETLAKEFARTRHVKMATAFQHIAKLKELPVEKRGIKNMLAARNTVLEQE